jgi:inhibitor of cysteine peptidase
MIGGCGSDDVTFTDPGTRFEVDPGDEFVVVLESNPTTGFSWQLEVEPPDYIVRFVSSVYVEPDTDLVGAAGRQELTFEAVGEGTAEIQLWYVRGFDDPPEPADRAQFEVAVGDVISVAELLADSPQDPVSVTGLLFDDGSGVRLCGVLAESFPPQCIGEAVVISNPETIEVEFTSEAGVRWTDRPVVLFGELVDGEFRLRVAGLPTD